MKLGKLSAIVFALVALLFFLPSHANAQWHNWQQWQRYGATVNTSLSQVGFQTGMNAKTWVQFVIYSGSMGSVMLPATKLNMYEWYPHPYVYKFPSWHTPDQWQAGQIIQMRWRNRPHTAIFICNYYSKEQNGMYWVDCNWIHPWNNRTVQYHFVSFEDFARNVGSCYSVYEIR